MSDDPIAPETAAAAFHRLADERAALQPDELVPVNTDVTRAASQGIVTSIRLAPLVPELEREIGHPLEPRILRLADYSLAAWYAGACAYRLRDQSVTKALATEGRPLKAKLLDVAKAFTHVGFIDPRWITQLRSGRGEYDLARDLVALSHILEEAWPKIGGNTLVTAADVRRASELGSALLRAMSQGDRAGKAKRAEVRDRTARAFTLLVHVYGRTQRMLAMARWRERDAHLIAPSLFDHRSGKRKKRESPSAAKDAAPESKQGPEAAPASSG